MCRRSNGGVMRPLYQPPVEKDVAVMGGHHGASRVEGAVLSSDVVGGDCFLENAI